MRIAGQQRNILVLLLLAITLLSASCSPRAKPTPTAQPELGPAPTAKATPYPAPTILPTPTLTPAPTPTPMPTPTPRAIPTTALHGQQAPDFTLNNLLGERISLSQLKGKLILLNFWATWCGPCQQEIPELEAFHEEYKGKGVLVLAVNLREDKSKVAAFAKENKMNLMVLLDSEGRVGEAYGIVGIPTTFFIDQDLIIRDSILGSTFKSRLVEKVSPLLNKK